MITCEKRRGEIILRNDLYFSDMGKHLLWETRVIKNLKTKHPKVLDAFGWMNRLHIITERPFIGGTRPQAL